MRILAIDVGGRTQDILLLDTSMAAENSIKMIMPSPTITVAAKVEAATMAGEAILFTGVNMGSGPCKFATSRHLEAGLKAYATPEAATTFDDDLEEVKRMGVTLVSPDEARRLKGVTHVEMRDLDLSAIGRALEAFGVSPAYDALAVAVLDHGAAPPGVSDRRFRFQHLLKAVQKDNSLTGFAYLRDEIPPYLTRMKAVAESADAALPLLLLDTGASCTLGAMEDPAVAGQRRLLMINAGNFHTIVFNLEGKSIMGFFEHHTGRLNSRKLDGLMDRLLSGALTNQEVFDDEGHGCCVLRIDNAQPFVAITGPRRRMMAASRHRPYFAAPFGDMMVAGCFGLAGAFASRVETWREEIERVLGSSVD